MHLLEFAENSVDFQHFGPLHGDMFIPWTRFTVPGIKNKHEADWSADPDTPHRAYFNNRAILQVFGRYIERTRASSSTSSMKRRPSAMRPSECARCPTSRLRFAGPGDVGHG